MKKLAVFWGLLFFLSPCAPGERTAQASDPGAGLSLEAARIAPVDASWRAKLPRDPRLATEAYLQRIPRAAVQRANSYFEGKYWLTLWDLVVGLVITWLLLARRFSARLRDRIEGWTSRKPLQWLIFAAIYILLNIVLSWPWTLYESFFREHAYGLLNQTFLPWFKDQLIGGGVQILLGSPFYAVLYAVVHKAPRSWPIWGTMVAILFLGFGTLISPVWIDPLFNTYQPLGAGPVRESILSLARANGIPAKEVYEFNASKQSDRVSANVSGFLGTMSVRLNDNLLRRASLPEIRAVMGHEMGHYVLNHPYKILMEFSIAIYLCFVGLRGSFEWLRVRFEKPWGIRSMDDIAGLPLAAALVFVFLFLLTPVTNTIIRTEESEADIFGLNAAREPDGFAEVSLLLTEYRKPDPGALEEFVFFDHPSTRNRVYMAMRWKAEN
jgi:STE24 endopeptidase